MFCKSVFRFSISVGCCPDVFFCFSALSLVFGFRFFSKMWQLAYSIRLRVMRCCFEIGRSFVSLCVVGSFWFFFGFGLLGLFLGRVSKNRKRFSRCRFFAIPFEAETVLNCIGVSGFGVLFFCFGVVAEFYKYDERHRQDSCLMCWGFESGRSFVLFLCFRFFLAAFGFWGRLWEKSERIVSESPAFLVMGPYWQ